MFATLPFSQRFFAPQKSAVGRIQRLGIWILGAIVLSAVAAPLLTPYGPKELACVAFEKPSSAHLLGCDDAGRDLLSQLLYGARVSLLVGGLVATLSTAIAAALAVVVGVYGGWVDRFLMRFVDVVLALPFMPLVIVLGVYFGASIQTQVMVIALISWASPLRELRAQVLALRSAGFVEASRSMGAGAWFVGTRHILPELAPLIVPQFIRIAHAAILVETSLAFLGLGDPLQESWGTILFHANARAAFLTGAWVWWILPPGLMISLTMLSLAFIGFGYNGAPLQWAQKGQALPPKAPSGAGLKEGSALSAEGLDVMYDTANASVHAVKSVSIDLERGALVGLVGESGSGKTSAAMAILRLLRAPARVPNGAVFVAEGNLLQMQPALLRSLRGKRIALIPQSAMNALNPVMTLGEQLCEALALGQTPPAARRAKGEDWLMNVGLEPKHFKSYPHELSGGMKQRAVIAIALCNAPDVVIADEPTTGLDVLVQEDIMALLLDLRQRLGLSVLFVTHNLPLIARHADRIAVMYQGRIVDEGRAEDLARAPKHPHTAALMDALLPLTGARRWHTADAFGLGEVLSFEKVGKTYRRGGLFGIGAQETIALEDVSFTLAAGEKLGVVGGSGAGKSTLARLLTGRILCDHGRVVYRGENISDLGARTRRAMSRAVHMVFQDPYQSLRNGMTLFEVVAEPLHIHGQWSAEEIRTRVCRALEAVQLPSDAAFLARKPVQLSGGQRQRIAFARALVLEPSVIIADEPTSMLDQSVRMEVMDLMEDLRLRFGTAFLFITHDIALARHFCDRLIVLKEGKVVEMGETESVIHAPQQDYTRRLIAAA